MGLQHRRPGNPPPIFQRLNLILMPAEKPVAATVLPWLKANLGSLGALTGTDHKALQSAVHIVELACYAPSDLLYAAFSACVRTMQPRCRHFAYHAVAHVANWSDRERWWNRAGLEPLAEPGICKHEPQFR